MEFHRTAYLGPLIDAAYAVPFQEAPKPLPKEPKPAHTVSPEDARRLGDKVSGRILSVVTNLPYVATLHQDAPGLRQRRGLSSLNALLDHVTSKTGWENVNIGWLGEIEALDEGDQVTKDQQQALDSMLGPSNKSVWLPQPCIQWRDFAERELWPVLHYSWNSQYNSLNHTLSRGLHSWNNYVRFNEAYLDVVLKEYREGDLIMVHDMYLFLLPSMIRKHLPNASIGLYVHTPFPSSELFRILAQREELLHGMLGATIIGFQSEQYIKHFLSAATRLLGLESAGTKILFDGRYVACVAQPFGVNVGQVLNRAASPEVPELSREIRKLYGNKRIIVGRDKLDSTQGILQKLQAFYTLLEMYPQWRGKLVYVQITTLTWQYTPVLEQQMSHMIAFINAKYGNLNYTPIVHFSKHIEQDEYIALLRTADVGFFTPTREGASSAAVEYVLCQNSRDDIRAIGATMVLSEFMGITDLMSQSDMAVNPYDALQMSFMLDQALTMSEVATRSEKDHHIVKTAHTNHDVGTFFTAFLTRLIEHDLRHENQHYTPRADVQKIDKSFKNAKRRLVLLDYDGTLTPIVRDPAAAVPSERLKSIFKDLTAQPNTSVWIISGRDKDFLDQHMSAYKINLSAEHGCFVKYAQTGPQAQWEDLVAKLDMSWMKVVMDVLQSYTERTEGSNIERKQSAITWHYRRSDPEFGQFQASHLRAYLELTVAKKYPIDVMAGKANVEIRPKLFNKGEIVANIFRDAHRNGEVPDFVLCLGDDTTDEDMFRVLTDQPSQQGIFSTLVGPENRLTIARYHVNNVDEAHDLLDSLKAD